MRQIEFSEELAKQEIKELLDLIKNDNRIIAVYLYGSYIKNRTKKESDVDVCIITENPIKDIWKYNQFDLVQISDFWNLSPIIQYEILQNGKQIFLNKDKEHRLRKINLITIGEKEYYYNHIIKPRLEMILNARSL